MNVIVVVAGFLAIVGPVPASADAKKRKLAVDPLDGEALQRVVIDIAATPKPLLNQTKTFIRRNKK